MAMKTDLTDFLLKKQFNKIEATFRKHYKLPIETTDAEGNDIRKLCSKGCHPEFCKAVKASRPATSRCRQDRLRSLTMAFETGQPYISICHAGIVLVCVPIMGHDTPLGAFFFGKCLSEPVTDIIERDILKRLRGLRLKQYKIIPAACELPIVTARKIHEAAEFLFILLYEMTELDPHIIKWQRQKSKQQAAIGEHIQHSKKHPDTQRQYPYHSERELIGKVKIGDRTGAKEILNELLGTIMFLNPGDLNVLKARLVELLTVLSRAAVEGGVNIRALLEKNLEYINTVINIDTQEELCAWISKALNDFIDNLPIPLSSRYFDNSAASSNVNATICFNKSSSFPNDIFSNSLFEKLRFSFSMTG